MYSALKKKIQSTFSQLRLYVALCLQFTKQQRPEKQPTLQYLVICPEILRSLSSADILQSMFADVLLLIGLLVVFDEHVKSLNKFAQQ